MKRPSTASAGLNFLNQGHTIEMSSKAVGAFLRYCERNKPGFELSVVYGNEMAVIKPVNVPVETPSLKGSLKAGLEKAGLNFGKGIFSPGLRQVS